jgi:3-phosphoshikimate 1-carboxyvinyltransferase
MERMGCVLSRPTPDTIRCIGKLHSGSYEIRGDISSQYISGLLFAMALMEGASALKIIGKLESKPYVDMTCATMKLFGIDVPSFQISGCYPFHSPGEFTVEGDWSNAAFFLTAAAIGNSVSLENLNLTSAQGDRTIIDHLTKLSSGFCDIDAADIPDLVPILSIAAASMHGCQFTNIARLRLKESDRVASVIQMLSALGIQANATENTLSIMPGSFSGGVVDSENDHRIAMAAAIAATVASAPVTILGAQCVNKSYPTFWDEYRRLGGNYEQHVR